MKCKNCGEELDDNAKYCINCGEPIFKENIKEESFQKGKMNDSKMGVFLKKDLHSMYYR